MADEQTTSAPDDVEFFGVKLKVQNPKLAALLNSSVHDDVQVIGRRAVDAFSSDDPAAARQGADDDLDDDADRVVRD